MQLSRRMLLSGAAAALAIGGPALASPAVQVIGGRAFGSTWRAVLPADADAAKAAALIDDVVAEVDAAMSPWRPDSEVSRVNRSGAGVWHPVSAALAHVAAAALDLHRLTDGAFDPSIGPLVARYGFGPITDGTWSPPGAEGLEVGEGALRKADPGLTLDLCGIAKGHALDRVVAWLGRAGARSALVELGGEVRALGRHPEGRAWQVAVERPGTPDWAAQRIIAPAGLALATSGHAPNGAAGRIALSHVIDPGTARPADQHLLSVSVLAPEAMRADALATALLALGADRGPDMATRLGIPALFLLAGNGAPDEVMTAGFADYITA